MKTNLKTRRFIIFIVILLLGAISIFVIHNKSSKEHYINLFKRSKRHVFFDLGANIGDSARFFVEIDNNPPNNTLKGYGARNDTKWEIYAFEANPVHNEKLDQTKHYCESLGHKFYLYKQTAAWIRNEKLTFYLDTVNVQNNYWGASVIKEHPDPGKSKYQNVEVDAVDIAELIKKYSIDDEVIVKVDIEGAEFQFLKHLINEGAMKYIDIIAVEFHFFNDKIGTAQMKDFFKILCSMLNIRYMPWYLGHAPFHD